MKSLIFSTLLSVVFAFAIASPVDAAVITVKNGDSLWKIANRYNVSFAEVLRLNRQISNPDLIHIGDKVYIPEGSHGSTTSNGSAGANPSQGNDSAIAGSTAAKENAVLLIVNNERKKQGLNPLSLSSKLSEVARLKSEDMATKNYFAHDSPTYGSPFDMMKRFGVSYKSAGENIAAGQKTAEEVMQSWMNSSGHRANILNPKFTELGVGYYAGGKYRTYWTQEFISK